MPVPFYSPLDDYLNGRPYDPNRALFNTGLGAGLGALADPLQNYIKSIFPQPGINVGIGSYASIAAQINTKAFITGSIDDFTNQTAGKILNYEFFNTVPRDTLTGGAQTILDTSLFGEDQGTGTHVEQDVGGKFIKLNGS